MSAILFDCDGVLIDSEPMGCRPLAQAITAAGFPMTSEGASAIFPGNGAEETRAWMRAQGLDGEAVRRQSDLILFEMFERDVPLVPGIDKVLQAFDVPMAVCSNSLIDRLEASLGRTSLAARFKGHIYSAEQVPRAKPAPDLALFAARQLDVPIETAVFIDDNIHGVACARAAGCIAIGFIGPSDHRPDQEARLRAAGAHHVVHGAGALLELLGTLIDGSLKRFKHAALKA